MMKLKDKARLYFGAVNAYDQKQVSSMICPNYIQHNPYVPTGREAFVDFLPTLSEHGSQIHNFRMLEDGNHIIMHHKWTRATPFGGDTMIAFHIVRFDSQGLIAEHWNVIAEEGSATSRGPVAIQGRTDLDVQASANITKKYATHLIGSWIDEGSQIEGLEYLSLQKIFAENDFALAISEGSQNGVHSALYDLIRIEDGAVKEHWNVYQPIPVADLANDNGMFGFVEDRL
ncbi:MAG: nuclear transport factor 2 family protein [Pseudomonadota bacterium]